MSEKNKTSAKERSYAPIHIATPFILAALCLAVVIAAAIKPADKLKVYANLAFMDDLKTTADNTGLVIRDQEIVQDYEGEVSETGEVIRPKFGELFGLLSSEAFSVDIPVYWGSTSELLEHGACQSSGSALPGTDGNAVISAHVHTFFNPTDDTRLTLYTCKRDLLGSADERIGVICELTESRFYTAEEGE